MILLYIYEDRGLLQGVTPPDIEEQQRICEGALIVIRWNGNNFERAVCELKLDEEDNETDKFDLTWKLI